MASPLEAFKRLSPPVRFGIIGVGTVGLYVFYKKWKAAKSINAATTAASAPMAQGQGPLPGYDNGGGGGGIGGMMPGYPTPTDTNTAPPATAPPATAPGAISRLSTADQASLYGNQLRSLTSLLPSQSLTSTAENNLPGNESPNLVLNTPGQSGMVSATAIPYNPGGDASQASGFGSLANPLWQGEAASYQRKYGTLPTAATPASAFLGLN